MSFLDRSVQVVRLLSAIVWLAVGVLTFWATLTAVRDPGRFLAPFFDSIQRSAVEGTVNVPLPRGIPLDILQRGR